MAAVNTKRLTVPPSGTELEVVERAILSCMGGAVGVFVRGGGNDVGLIEDGGRSRQQILERGKRHGGVNL